LSWWNTWSRGKRCSGSCTSSKTRSRRSSLDWAEHTIAALSAAPVSSP